MVRARKQPEPEEPPGAPDWMVTYCDSMTLMLTFFVLLFSFASFDESVFRKLSMAFGDAIFMAGKDKSAFLSTIQISDLEEVEEGSEKATLERGKEDGLEEETKPVNVHNRKVFLISSGKIFYGNGRVISLQGRKTLSVMASFLREMPCRIVISENGLGDDEDSKQFGLLRAWAVLKYLAAKPGLDKGWFSLATDTLQRYHKNNQQDNSRAKTERTLEIVLLERSIYN